MFRFEDMDTASGYWQYLDDAEDVGQNWIGRCLKCAHCGYRFIGVYPDDLTSNNCPECQRATRLRVLF